MIRFYQELKFFLCFFILLPMSKLNTRIIRTPRKRGKPISVDEKWMVIRVFSRCKEERQSFQSVRTVDPYQRTSDYTGVGRRQVVEIVSYFNKTGQVTPPKRCGNRITHPPNIPSWGSKHNPPKSFIRDKKLVRYGTCVAEYHKHRFVIFPLKIPKRAQNLYHNLYQ